MGRLVGMSGGWWGFGEAVTSNRCIDKQEKHGHELNTTKDAYYT